jgi:hypothetical protein
MEETNYHAAKVAEARKKVEAMKSELKESGQSALGAAKYELGRDLRSIEEKIKSNG